MKRKKESGKTTAIVKKRKGIGGGGGNESRSKGKTLQSLKENGGPERRPGGALWGGALQNEQGPAFWGFVGVPK